MARTIPLSCIAIFLLAHRPDDRALRWHYYEGPSHSSTRQESQLETLKSQKANKRVAVDQNARFANIETIKKAIDEAKEQEAWIQARQPEIKAKKALDAALTATMESCMFKWQAY